MARATSEVNQQRRYGNKNGSTRWDVKHWMILTDFCKFRYRCNREHHEGTLCAIIVELPTLPLIDTHITW